MSVNASSLRPRRTIFREPPSSLSAQEAQAFFQSVISRNQTCRVEKVCEWTRQAHHRGVARVFLSSQAAGSQFPMAKVSKRRRPLDGSIDGRNYQETDMRDAAQSFLPSPSLASDLPRYDPPSRYPISMLLGLSACPCTKPQLWQLGGGQRVVRRGVLGAP